MKPAKKLIQVLCAMVVFFSCVFGTPASVAAGTGIPTDKLVPGTYRISPAVSGKIMSCIPLPTDARLWTPCQQTLTFWPVDDQYVTISETENGYYRISKTVNGQELFLSTLPDEKLFFTSETHYKPENYEFAFQFDNDCGRYVIKSVFTGCVMEVLDGSSAENNPIVLRPEKGDINQQFVLFYAV